ncbi:MAG: FliO/MopB family protein [Planctomycetes bacterium]|nr:FliO/MopB family protein [Planctomycetota bacterium]
MRSFAIALAFCLICGGLARAGDTTFDESRLMGSGHADKATRGTEKSSAGSKAKERRTTGSWWTTLGSLTAVLALVVLTAKVLKMGMPAARRSLPTEAVQVLGRKPLDYKNSIHLVRCGARLLVIGSSQTGLATLAEISDPAEIDYLSGLCLPGDAPAVGESFQQLFRKFQSRKPAESVAPGGDSDRPATIDPAAVRLQARLHKAGGLRPDDERSPRFEELAG